tara:strand:+ start:34858 stop:35289 length:432 start_codon:yes stop_codon:yes gene_type:complete
MKTPFLLATLAVCLSSCAVQKPLPSVDPPTYAVDLEPIDFQRQIQPILEAQCLHCHHANSEVAFSMATRESILAATTPRRPILVPGKAEKSTFFLVTQLPDYFVEAMPADGHQLTEEQSTLVYRWIMEGAPWPDGVRLGASSP